MEYVAIVVACIFLSTAAGVFIAAAILLVLVSAICLAGDVYRMMIEWGTRHGS